MFTNTVKGFYKLLRAVSANIDMPNLSSWTWCFVVPVNVGKFHDFQRHGDIANDIYHDTWANTFFATKRKIAYCAKVVFKLTNFGALLGPMA